MSLRSRSRAIEGVARGSQTLDITDKCLQLCRKYLPGVWTQATDNEIRVTRMTGGLTNQIYLCQICDTITKGQLGQQPRDVIIRLNGNTYDQTFRMIDNQRFNDSIIALLVSQTGLGPQLYGMDPSAQILRYYKHRTFDIQDLNDPNLLRELAQKLARVHALPAPVAHNENYIEMLVHNNAKLITAEFVSQLTSLCSRHQCHHLMGFDIRREIAYMTDYIARNSTDSPVVFSHNDFRGGNVLVTEGSGLVLTDFDHSSYGWRGFDFGEFFASFITETDDLSKGFPMESTIRSFVEYYKTECQQWFGSDYGLKVYNSTEYMVNEIKFFVLFNYLFVISCFVLNDMRDGLPMDERAIMSALDS
ncbi:unnamed protein product [Oppiella nova]|uniref:Choline/ethanolamine kinase n=1 Tax=Oppiella nova TaxID=334625 RepID=A0A7R9LG99_9ACAR|nr:unnamed protein product [Oppiella nova]CAG2162907.1 unnamed protein product [Oppiella nova]